MVDVSSSKNSITITVGNTNKNNSVAITPGTANNSITTKSDTAQYWSNLSRDYSEQAKTSAYKAEQVKNEIITQKDSIIADIENTGVNAVDNITTIKSESIADINNTVADGIDNISTLKNDSLQEIETKADDIIADIQENVKSLPMFTPMWTDHIYNDASYLRADTFSWQNADIYITGYKILENEYNNENCVTEIDNGIEYRLSPNGFKIADASQNEAILDLYESGNEAWFYIIDTENKRFKLPREKKTDGKYLYFYVGTYGRPEAEVNLGTVTDALNNKVDLDGGNYAGSGLEAVVKKNGGGGGLEIGDIGIAPLGIDETKGKRRYLNGQVILQDQYRQFTKKVKSAVALYPSLACTESEWQTTATMTVGGQVGKFVVDDEAGTIRLPKIIMPIQGLTDLSKLAEIVEAGLPNITGTVASGSANQGYGEKTGAFTYTTKTVSTGGNTGADSLITISFDASRSNPIYGNSDTVQQEQIQYPYFIQVATGAEVEDNIINEIELNNPFSLLDYKYSEYELNNISWLRSNGQYNSKAIYPAVYDLLLKIYNGTETKAGVSVKLSAEDYTDYDFVLNTAEETFRLPIKVKLASGKAVVGNGMTLGLTEGSNNYGVIENSSNNLVARTSAWDKTVGTSVGDSGSMDDNKVVGITTDATKSGLETSNSDLYLYFYVGETVQNANLINAGRIEEKIASVIPNNSELIASYGIPDYSAGITIVLKTNYPYIAPSDGFVFFNTVNNGNPMLYVNGSTALERGLSTEGGYTLSGFIRVGKDDVLTTNDATNYARYFFPLKGAI